MKILQLAVSLDYGGTETYVTRLARGLSTLGHEVAVLTEGGPLEALLESYGIEVMRRSLLPSALGDVAGEISGKGFEVINAHKYNGARVGYALSKMSGIPYIMTVHGPRSLAKRIFVRYWSPQVIALSRSDRDGICGFLGLARDRVHVSFPAIDPDRHFARAPDPETLTELWPEPGVKLVAHVSRFTNRKARVALELVRAMPEILKTEPAARLLIVGTGEMFDVISKRVAGLNASVGPVAQLLGPRLDVSTVFSAASVVVATAATAMEAMACGAPLIAAGRTGYLGPVYGNRLDEGLGLLFGDHGKCSCRVTAERLAQDITGVLRDPEKWRATAADLAHTVSDRFSPVAVARDVLQAYEAAVLGALAQKGDLTMK